MDWQPPAGVTLERHANGLLDAERYRTTIACDALNRVKAMRYPQDVKGERKELRPHYNRAGDLERVELDGAAFVEHIAYSAKGQRTLARVRTMPKRPWMRTMLQKSLRSVLGKIILSYHSLK